MGNNKNPNETRPGEKAPGTFHFNPGNMSGKTPSAGADKREPKSARGKHNRPEEEDKADGDNC